MCVGNVITHIYKNNPNVIVFHLFKKIARVCFMIHKNNFDHTTFCKCTWIRIKKKAFY